MAVLEYTAVLPETEIEVESACPNCGDFGGLTVERYDAGDAGVGYGGGYETCCTLCVRGGGVQ